MRTRVALLDGALSNHLESFISLLPTQWLYAVIRSDGCIDIARGWKTFVPPSRSQSCECTSGICIRDAIIAWLPDRALVVAVLQQPSLQCIAESADVVFATGEVARWCYQRNIAVRHASSVEELYQLFASVLQRNAISTRHQAQIYRNLLLEIE